VAKRTALYEKAQLIFKFGKGEQSPIARVLGVQNVLIFDYSEKVAFDVDKFDLKPEALPILNTQADILNVYFPKARVFVCGYTDATGTDEHNLRLSLKRAQAVADYLVARQVDKGRLEIRGFGKDYPVESNATPAGRLINRRTEAGHNNSPVQAPSLKRFIRSRMSSGARRGRPSESAKTWRVDPADRTSSSRKIS
jgi:outer membrane protein OmpA-like peptidoglycan-associated protein